MKDSPTSVSERDGRRRSRLLFMGALTALGLLTMLHLLLVYRHRGFPLSLREAFLSGLATWYPWAILAPMIFPLSRRYCFEPDRWRMSLLVHALAGGVFGVLYCGIRALLSYIPWIDAEPLPISYLLVTQFHLFFLGYVAIVSIHQAFLNYQRYQDRALRASQLETKLAQAQLEALRMQLHPHFLFNTLHAISTLVHRDPDAADEMIAQLSDLLRSTLQNIGVPEIPLREELDFLRRYLDIQRTRFQDRLHVTIDAPEAVLDVRVPNHILQPLVENAIRHGVDGRPGGGLVEVTARRVNGRLEMAVRDDGPGMPPGGAGRIVEGIGLANTRARLSERYGTRATLTLANHPAGGAIVRLSVPIAAGAPPSAADRPPGRVTA